MLCISLLFSCTTTIEQPPQPAQESVSSSNSTQSSSSEIRIVEKGKVIGVSQKGPFTKGSAITLSELNDKLAQTGRSFEATITDDKGSFEIGIKDILHNPVNPKIGGIGVLTFSTLSMFREYSFQLIP